MPESSIVKWRKRLPVGARAIGWARPPGGDDPGSGLVESGEEAEALGLEIGSGQDVRSVAGKAKEPDHGVGRLVACVDGSSAGVEERGRLPDVVGGRLSGFLEACRADEGGVAAAAGLGRQVDDGEGRGCDGRHAEVATA